ncbi:opticin-like isoform X2 [Protopterus annectens]|nr:opticin-like isoform X2 [Protopterus annectens]
MKTMLSLAFVLTAFLTLGVVLTAPVTDTGKEKKTAKESTLKNEGFDLDSFDLDLDNYGETLDITNYADLYDYGEEETKIEVGTLPPPSNIPKAIQNERLNPSTEPGEEKDEKNVEADEDEKETLAEPSKPSSVVTPASSGPKSADPQLFGQQTEGGLPTCLTCVCLGTSVYCDDTDLTTIPPLPKDTTYLYARFNKIEKIRATDFAGLNKLKKVDLTSCSLSWIDEDAFRTLPALEELIVAENLLTALPELPTSMVRIDARLNKLRSIGIKQEAFKDLTKLQFLYLSDNRLDYIPLPLPESLRSLHLQNNNIQSLHNEAFCDKNDPTYIRKSLEDIRLDGNPINLSLYPNAYSCLPRIPTGNIV